MTNVIISAIAIIVSIITFIYSKIDSRNQEIRNRIDSGNQEIRSLINFSVRDYNNRIDNTNNRIDQVYQAPTINPS